MKTSFKLKGFVLKVTDEVDVKVEVIETAFEGSTLEVVEQMKTMGEIFKDSIIGCGCGC